MTTMTTRSKKSAAVSTAQSRTTSKTKHNSVKNKVQIKKEATKKKKSSMKPSSRPSPHVVLPPFNITSVRENDVLLGRGKGFFEHKGNVRFLKITEPFGVMYKTAERYEKRDIVRRALESILSTTDGTTDAFKYTPRFLVQQEIVNPDGTKPKKTKKRKKKTKNDQSEGGSPQVYYRLATYEERTKKLAHRLREVPKKNKQMKNEKGKVSPPPPTTSSSSSADIITSNIGYEEEEVEYEDDPLPFDHQEHVQLPLSSRPLSPAVVSDSDYKSSTDDSSVDSTIAASSDMSCDEFEEDYIPLSLSSSVINFHPEVLDMLRPILPGDDGDDKYDDEIMGDEFEPICVSNVYEI